MFGLYYSAIRYGNVRMEDGAAYYTEKDLFSDEWKHEVKVDEELNGRLRAFFRLDLLKITRNFGQYAALESGASPWGDIYEREGEMLFQRECRSAVDVLILNETPIAFIAPGRENTVVLVNEGCEKLTVLREWQDCGCSPAECKVRHLDTFFVRTRDGANLATDVWLPEGEGPFPVVMTRTPYGRFHYAATYMKFVKRGYALVAQDVRGREDSDGDWIPMHYEIDDGYDTLSYIAGQSWCNGNIGMIGASYGGFTQWAAAASGHKNLKAMVSMVTAGSAFVDLPKKGGALGSGTLAWAFAMRTKRLDAAAMVRDDWEKVLGIRPISQIPMLTLGEDIPFFTKWVEHDENDAFWQKSDWFAKMPSNVIPALIQSGWYDDDGFGTTQAWEIAKNYPKDDRLLLLGPWIHNGNASRDIHAAKLGNNALLYDLDLYHQRWFDEKLKNIDTGLNAEQGVRFYVLGANEWREAKSFPPEGFEPYELLLGADGSLGRQAQKEGTITYEYDPLNPAPHVIDVSENEVAVPGDYSKMEERSDVITFTTAELEGLEIACDPCFELYASSSALDTDWIVRLTDVGPDGSSVKLSEGILRAKFRNGFEHAQLLQPGKVEKFVIPMAKVANRFEKGHRLRVHITSSAENLSFPNYNTGKTIADETQPVVALQMIFCGGEYASKIKLYAL